MMAKALALNGAKKVYIVGRRLDKLEEAAKESPTGNIIPLQGDVTSKESLESCTEHVRKEVGYVNLVICNSGVTGPPHAVNMAAGTSARDLQKQVLATPMEDFTQAFSVNVSGVYYTAFAFLDLLEEGNKKENALEGVTSQVLVTGSIAAYNRSVGAGIAYNTSKAAVTHLVKILAGIFVPYSVRVNAIAPGCKFSSRRTFYHEVQRANSKRKVFPSDLSASLLAGRGDSTQIGSFPKSFIPAEKTGDEQDMAGTILYMASRAAAYCTALILVVDGGRLTLLPGSY
jgi:NAD(P)-dependent dehydrogenase (short-subunit alcohol dehydrogenase family)